MISTTRNLLSIKRLLNIHRLQPRTVAFIHTGQIMNSIKDLSENKWQPQDALPPHIKELLTTGSAPSNYMLAFYRSSDH